MVTTASARPSGGGTVLTTDSQVDSPTGEAATEEITTGQWVNPTSSTKSRTVDNHVRCDIIGPDPAQAGRFFTSVETPADADVDRVEIFALIEPGSQGSFTVKAAYLP